MTVFEYAKKMELDGKAMYEGELANTRNEGMKTILLMLARAEQNHYEIFSAMEKKKKPEALQPVSFAEIKNIFEKMKEKGDYLNIKASQAEFYEKALEIEEKTEEFYKTEAGKSANAEIKEQLLTVAAEEHRHVELMSAMYHMVNRPNEWLATSEWNYLREY
ncbi:MAG: hypothetical protein E4H36_01885 [Spirochaetales bacterium]|nr:MAG: hypothetical protein E4H36_01885 [Spirochaetales bacterium]